LLFEGKKMSKSKGNLFTLENILEKGFSAMDLRLLFLSSHYRSQMEFSFEALEQAHKNIQKINDFVLNLEAAAARDLVSSSTIDTKAAQEKFEAAMDDDLNTPLALSVFYEFISQCNKLFATNHMDSKSAHNILAFWKKINSVFGLVLSGQAEIPEEIKELMKKREQARHNKDFEASDKLRTLIEKHGFVIEDTANGPIVKMAD
jgi:cysteinyl-tRNA synthetase